MTISPAIFEPVPTPTAGAFKIIRLVPDTNCADVVCLASFGAEYISVTPFSALATTGYVTTLAEARRIAASWNAK